MKRLKLEDFKLKNLKKDKSTTTDQLLGQVLGDCHDGGCTLIPHHINGVFIYATDLPH